MGFFMIGAVSEFYIKTKTSTKFNYFKFFSIYKCL